MSQSLKIPKSFKNKDLADFAVMVMFEIFFCLIAIFGFIFSGEITILPSLILFIFTLYFIKNWFMTTQEMRYKKHCAREERRRIIHASLWSDYKPIVSIEEETKVANTEDLINEGPLSPPDNLDEQIQQPIESTKEVVDLHEATDEPIPGSDTVLKSIQLIEKPESLVNEEELPTPAEETVNDVSEYQGQQVHSPFSTQKQKPHLQEGHKEEETNDYIERDYEPEELTQREKAEQEEGFEEPAEDNSETIKTNIENRKQKNNPKETKLSKPDQTERRSSHVARVGQDYFKQELLKRFNGKCAVTGNGIQSILKASHIVSWKNASDEEKLDIANGILLCPLYDKLFDKHLISFDEEGYIIFSDKLLDEDINALGINKKAKIPLYSNMERYLSQHRKELR